MNGTLVVKERLACLVKLYATVGYVLKRRNSKGNEWALNYLADTYEEVRERLDALKGGTKCKELQS